MKPGPYGPFPYSPIIRRPRLKWPGDARLALWVVPNIEFFSLETRPGGLGPGKIPDIPIWAMRDYGNRVGVFRLMEVLDRYRVRATVALNSDICLHHPEIIEEGEKRRWEWMGHNQSNSRRLNEVSADEEPQIIRETLDTIARVSGRRPVGWLGAGLQETWNNTGSPGRGRLRICCGLGAQRRSALHDDAQRGEDAGVASVQLQHQ